jgi:hypothetical protein
MIRRKKKFENLDLLKLWSFVEFNSFPQQQLADIKSLLR